MERMEGAKEAPNGIGVALENTKLRATDEEMVGVAAKVTRALAGLGRELGNKENIILIKEIQLIHELVKRHTGR